MDTVIHKKLSSPLILASASPRRKLLLEQAGYSFDIAVPDIDEAAHLSDSISAIAYTKLLAFEKAQAVAHKHPAALVIGADTIVYADGKIIGKADDHDHAREIIELLFSRPHEVITGVALIKLDEHIRIVESVTTIVYPKKLTPAQIDQHIQKGDWQGKAGAYGIQETGDEFVERIDGSLTNVMGFPMELVNDLLKQFVVKN
ncbi:MAG: Maf family protein, partial [Sedimentisphaerales bacterium]|nr:Maf family protein [Sedimentisphaerales bacterium]